MRHENAALAPRQTTTGIVGAATVAHYIWWSGGYFRGKLPSLPAGGGAAAGGRADATAWPTAQVSSVSAAGSINDTLGVELTEADVYGRGPSARSQEPRP